MRKLVVLLIIALALLLPACSKNEAGLKTVMAHIQFGELEFDIGSEWEYEVIDESIYFDITDNKTSGLAVGPTSFDSLEALISFFSDIEGERLTLNGMPAYEIIREDPNNGNVVYYSLYVEKGNRVFVYNFTFTKSDGMDELNAIYDHIKNSIT